MGKLYRVRTVTPDEDGNHLWFDGLVKRHRIWSARAPDFIGESVVEDCRKVEIDFQNPSICFTGFEESASALREEEAKSIAAFFNAFAEVTETVHRFKVEAVEKEVSE